MLCGSVDVSGVIGPEGARERERGEGSWSESWYATHTALPLWNSCFASINAFVNSWELVGVKVLIVSFRVVIALKTRTPFASGENFTTAVRLSPAAHALCGIMMEYMSFSGHVFSISSDCWYSSASGPKDRSNVTTCCVCRLCAKPGRVAMARSLYATEAPPYASV